MYNSSVINNGLTTDYFTPERGVRQGDSLSAYLFVVEAETLAITIRQTWNRTELEVLQLVKMKQSSSNTLTILRLVLFLNLLDVCKKLSGPVMN